jgi:hypothetical protein
MFRSDGRFWFGLMLMAATALPIVAHADVVEEEAWGIKGQATYIWQKKPSFDAAYSGTNSLGTQAEKGYSFSGTLFLGLRPWRGGELYFNPEVVQAVPMSSLTGLGGMMDSEQQRAATRILPFTVQDCSCAKPGVSAATSRRLNRRPTSWPGWWINGAWCSPWATSASSISSIAMRMPMMAAPSF